MIFTNPNIQNNQAIDLTQENNIKIYTSNNNYIELQQDNIKNQSDHGFKTILQNSFQILNQNDDIIMDVQEENIIINKQLFFNSQIQQINNSELQTGIVNKGYIDQIKNDLTNLINAIQNQNYDMNNFRIVNCAQPINNNDVTTLAFTQNQYMDKQTKLQDLSVKTQYDLNLYDNKIINVKNGTNNNDAVNLQQLTQAIQKVFIQNSAQKLQITINQDKKFIFTQLQNYQSLSLINGNQNIQTQPNATYELKFILSFTLNQISGVSYIQILKNNTLNSRYIIDKLPFVDLFQERQYFLNFSIISTNQDEYIFQLIDQNNDIQFLSPQSILTILKI